MLFGCLFTLISLILISLIEIGVLALLVKVICWAFGLVFSWKVILGIWAILVIFNLLVAKG